MRSRPRWVSAHRRPRPFLTEFIFGEFVKFLIKNQYKSLKRRLCPETEPPFQTYERGSVIHQTESVWLHGETGLQNSKPENSNNRQSPSRTECFWWMHCWVPWQAPFRCFLLQPRFLSWTLALCLGKVNSKSSFTRLFVLMITIEKFDGETIMPHRRSKSGSKTYTFP